VARKSSTGGLDIVNFDKNSPDLQCFIFQYGGAWGFFGRKYLFSKLAKRRAEEMKIVLL